MYQLSLHYEINIIETTTKRHYNKFHEIHILQPTIVGLLTIHRLLQ